MTTGIHTLQAASERSATPDTSASSTSRSASPARSAPTHATSQPPQTPALPPTLRHIVLTGFMGAGKTTTGRLLAARLGWSFLDLDDHVQTRTSLSIPDLFALHGEDHFRRLESSALASALARPCTVLALGGGTPELLTNRLLLEQTPGTLTIFLDAPFPVLFDRCLLQAVESSAVSRPVLADPALAQARFDLRRPLYRRLAHHTIDTSTLDSPATADAILATLAPQGR